MPISRFPFRYAGPWVLLRPSARLLSFEYINAHSYRACVSGICPALTFLASRWPPEKYRFIRSAFLPPIPETPMTSRSVHRTKLEKFSVLSSQISWYQIMLLRLLQAKSPAITPDKITNLQIDIELFRIIPNNWFIRVWGHQNGLRHTFDDRGATAHNRQKVRKQDSGYSHMRYLPNPVNLFLCRSLDTIKLKSIRSFTERTIFIYDCFEVNRNVGPAHWYISSVFYEWNSAAVGLWSTSPLHLWMVGSRCLFVGRRRAINIVPSQTKSPHEAGLGSSMW